MKAYLDFDNPYGNIVTNEMLEEVFRKMQGDNPLFRLEADIAKNQFSIKHITEPSKNNTKVTVDNSRIKLAGGARLVQENVGEGSKVSNIKLAGGAKLIK